MTTNGSSLAETVRHYAVARSGKPGMNGDPPDLPGSRNLRSAFWACPTGLHDVAETPTGQPYCTICDLAMEQIDQPTYDELIRRLGDGR